MRHRFSTTLSTGPAPVAQGIERRFPKPCVAGSNPAGGARNRSSEGMPSDLRLRVRDKLGARAIQSSVACGATRGSLREQRPGYWQLRVLEATGSITGKKPYRTRGFKGNRRAAQRALAALVTEVAAGRVAPSNVTMQQLFDEWLQHAEHLGRSPAQSTATDPSLHSSRRASSLRRCARSRRS
jgi:hypothetical protein